MPLIAEYAKRFGVMRRPAGYLSFALGAGRTTVMRMVTAYSMFANGGKRIKPTLIDHPGPLRTHGFPPRSARMRGCDADKWQNQNEPSMVDRREQVLDPMTAYQITSIMEGVVQRGTAAAAASRGKSAKPIAGKTGTTNERKDVWFVGYSPDLCVSVYMGYDKPRHIGRGASGNHTAAPIVKDFFKMALAKPRLQCRSACARHQADPHRRQVRHAHRGQFAQWPARAYKPGTAPADNYSVVGYQDGADPTQPGGQPPRQRGWGARAPRRRRTPTAQPRRLY